MPAEFTPQEFVNDWIQHRPKLSSMPDVELGIIDVAQEIHILEVALGENLEFELSFLYESEELQQMELGDVAFSLLSTAVIRKHGISAADSKPIASNNPEIFGYIETNLNKAIRTLNLHGLNDRNTKKIQKQISSPIRALRRFSESQNWDFDHIIEKVYDKNVTNYIWYYFSRGSPFEEPQQSIAFLRLMRNRDRIPDIILKMTTSIKDNHLWFISGHKDQNFIREITRNELLAITVSAESSDFMDRKIALQLLESADFSVL